MQNPDYAAFGMQCYKGYGLQKENGRWFVYTFDTNDGGRTWRPVKEGGYSNKLSAQRACDAHFGRL